NVRRRLRARGSNVTHETTRRPDQRGVPHIDIRFRRHWNIREDSASHLCSYVETGVVWIPRGLLLLTEVAHVCSRTTVASWCWCRRFRTQKVGCRTRTSVRINRDAVSIHRAKAVT